MEITASWPVCNTFKEFKLCQAMYDFDDQCRLDLIRQRLFKDRQNPLECLAPAEVRQKFRFFPHTIMQICELLNDKLKHGCKRSNPLTVLQQVCVALLYYGSGIYMANCDVEHFEFIPSKLALLSATSGIYYCTTGSKQYNVGEDRMIVVSRSTVQRCIHSVTEHLCSFMNDFIKFPTSMNEVSKTMEDFICITGKHF